MADFFSDPFLKSVSFGARVCPPLGAGEIFFGKPGDLLHFQTFSKMLIHFPYIDFGLNFISKFGQFQDIFIKNSLGNFHFEKIRTKNVLEKPLRKCEFKKNQVGNFLSKMLKNHLGNVYFKKKSR